MIPHIVVNVVISLLLPTLVITTPVPNDDITTIRQRVLELAVWPTSENVSDTVQSAIAFNHSLNSSCYWSDINYYDQRIVRWSTANHMYRITTMLQALTVNGSTVLNDPTIMANVHCTLKVWFDHDWQNADWWYNQINIPLQAMSQLLMLGNNATSLEIEKISQISYRAAWWLQRPNDIGANLVWMIQVEIYRSLATNNQTGIEQGFSRMWQDVAISNTTLQGIQFDYSYHFHGLRLLTGAYGVVWIQNILLFLQCSQNTKYQPNNQVLAVSVDYLIKGNAWMIMSNEWDWHVVGRVIGTPGNGFKNGFTTSWIRSVANMVKSNETQIELLNFADRLDSKPNVPALVGNRHFFVSDYQVHRRPNWIFTIKLQSVRTEPAECINGQNQKDENEGQGALNLYRAGVNDYLDVFAIIDWQAINGITVEHDIPLEPCKNGSFDMKKLSFVGGVSDDQYGLAFMDTATHNLTAQRSWHFYDDGVIALATNLTLTTSNVAWTTLASRLLRSGQVSIGFFNSTVITLQDGNYTFAYSPGKTWNVQWIHLGDSNIGYVLPLEQQYSAVGVQVGVKTGNYDAMGPFNSTISARMVTLLINHGQGPYTRDYNYMIVPNVSLESMPTIIKQYTEEQVFACISTKGNFHGTMWPSLKRAAFVLWENVTTTFSCKSPTFELNVELSDAGAYLYSESETNFTLTASHPMHVGGTVKVTVDRIGSGEGCTTSAKSDATQTDVVLPLSSDPQLLGISVNVTCNK